MKRLIAFILGCAFCYSLQAQITIMDNEPEVVEKIAKYDSLTNFKRMPYQSPEKDKYGYVTFHHLIGQTVMYCGEPYDTYFAPNLKTGEYYKIVGILPNAIDAGLYDRLQLQHVKDSTMHSIGGIGDYQKYNYQMVVLGHYEKLKSMYVGRSFVYVGNATVGYAYDKEDNLINFQTDTLTKNIGKGSVWKCIDVQVKPRKKDDYRSIDYRSTLVLLFDNAKYGKHYCYLESDNGEAFEALSYELPIVGPCFRDKETVDAYKKAEATAKKQHWDRMISKYGSSNGTLIAQGKVRIGMTSEMCRDAWGSPHDINRTTGAWGVHEQWVYSSGTYLYFEDGILTSIQN